MKKLPGLLDPLAGMLGRGGMLGRDGGVGQMQTGSTSAAGGGGGPGDGNAIQTEGNTIIHTESDTVSVATEAG